LTITALSVQAYSTITGRKHDFVVHMEAVNPAHLAFLLPLVQAIDRHALERLALDSALVFVQQARTEAEVKTADQQQAERCLRGRLVGQHLRLEPGAGEALPAAGK
jgi:hypothetical protein